MTDTHPADGAAVAEPESFAFDAESEAQIAALVAKYPPGRQASAVIGVLYVAQGQMRRATGSAWLPRVAMDTVARRLSMPPIRVYEAATFYLMFNTRPIGRFHLQVCTTTPCWLRGSDAVVAACRAATGVAGWGETSEDGMFTMTEVECLGACVNAPVVQVNDDFYEDLDGESTERLIAALRRGEPPAPGSMIGRQTSAPVGGPTTLTTPIPGTAE
jgi:NADH-quinone oxidoreductase E subunit